MPQGKTGKSMKGKRVKGLLERGISKLQEKYTDIYDRFDEDVALVLGMKYGHGGIQPCHNLCKSVCESSSGDSLCGGFLGYVPVEVEGNKLYVVMCDNGVRCGCHG